MALYEYRCLKCRTLFTERRPCEQRDDPASCPACGASGRRVLSVPQRWTGVWQEKQDPEKLLKTKEIWE